MSENVQADRADTGPAPSAPTPSITAASSLALRDIPIPDYCDVVIVPTRGVAETDPRVWADAIFSHENTPLRKRGMLAVRDEAIRLRSEERRVGKEGRAGKRTEEGRTDGRKRKGEW